MGGGGACKEEHGRISRSMEGHKDHWRSQEACEVTINIGGLEEHARLQLTCKDLQEHGKFLGKSFAEEGNGQSVRMETGGICHNHRAKYLLRKKNDKA